MNYIRGRGDNNERANICHAFPMLFLCFLAIIEVNSTPETKAKIAEQKKLELKAEEYLESERIENKSRLLSLSWGDVDQGEKIPWVMIKVINWQYSKFLFIAFIVITFPFLLSSYRERNRYFG